MDIVKLILQIIIYVSTLFIFTIAGFGIILDIRRDKN
jgi:hypothetical protein